jgi:hypothetical protein
MKRTIDDRDGNPVEIEIYEPYEGYYYICVERTNKWFTSFFRDGFFIVTDEEKYTPDECKYQARL